MTDDMLDTVVSDPSDAHLVGDPDSTARRVPGARTPRVRQQRWILIVAVTTALASSAGLAASTFIKSPAQQAASTKAPPASLVTAAVENRVLAQTVAIRGTVAASSTFPLTPQVATQGTAVAPVITGVHVNAGDRLKPGQNLMEVAGRPLFVLPGAVPAYRDMKPGDTGTDVGQLQDALKNLGFPSVGDQRGVFGAGTKQAVTAFYKHLGFEAPTTGGAEDAGDSSALQSAQTAVDDAQRAVDDERLLINAQSRQSPPPPHPPGQETEAEKLSYLLKALSEAQSAQEALIARTGPMVPLAEAAFLPSFPAQVQSFSGQVGDTVSAAGGPLITLATGQLRIVADADPSQISGLLKPGMKVDIAADALGGSATGVVGTVGTLTAPPATASGQSTNGQSANAQQAPTTPYIPVTVVPDKPLPAAWAGQNVALTVTAASTGTPVLVVPLSAVTTGADGRTTVSTVGPDGRTVNLVPVTAGISGAGYVAITAVTPGSLNAGDRVVVSDPGPGR